MNIPEYRHAFGCRVQELRKAKGFTSQEAFANHLGLDRTYISGIERGRRNPTLDVVVKIARGLDVHPSDLLSTIE